MTHLTEQQFLADVAQHRMTVLLDQGVHRHIHFGAPGTGNQHFTLTTFPDHLVFGGDMGTYVFSRLEDMFQFFRPRKPWQPGQELCVNLHYWEEKLEAVDNRGHASAKEYVPEKFIAAVKQYRRRLMRSARDSGLDHEERAELWEDIDGLVLQHAHDGKERATWAAHEFSFRVPDGDNEYLMFEDFHETDVEEYTLHYRWACFAIVWGIAQYDLAKALPAAA